MAYPHVPFPVVSPYAERRRQYLITCFGSVEHLAIIPSFRGNTGYVQQQRRLDAELHNIGLFIDRFMVY